MVVTYTDFNRVHKIYTLRLVIDITLDSGINHHLATEVMYTFIPIFAHIVLVVLSCLSSLWIMVVLTSLG